VLRLKFGNYSKFGLNIIIRFRREKILHKNKLYITIYIILIFIIFPVYCNASLVIPNNNQLINNESNSTRISKEGPVVEWERIFGGFGDDRGKSIDQTFDDGYIIAADTNKVRSGKNDIWLIKTDRNGEMQWNRSFGGNEHDSVRSIKQTCDGRYIITGSTQSFGSGKTDIWLLKIDNNGNEQWNQTFGGIGYDVGFSILELSDGCYIIVGYTESFGLGKKDMWLIKTDILGNMIWNKTYGGCDDDIGESIQSTNDGGYIIVGNTFSWGSCLSNVWLLKTDEEGDEQWNKTYGDDCIEMGLSVKNTFDGGYIISGIKCRTQYSNSDLWLIKTDSKGNHVWDKLFLGDFDDVGFSVIQTYDNGYFIAGYTDSYGEGWSDIYLVKTDVNGNMEWYTTLGGPDADVCFSHIKTSDKGFIIIGFTGFFELNNSYDVWLIKISSIENASPEKPEKPIGPVSGKTGNEYDYSTSTTDPDGDLIWYKWYWNEPINETSEWIGPFTSGQTMTTSHVWDEQGDYSIRVKAKDEHDAESEWSDALVVSMPRVKIFNQIPKIIIWLFERFPFLQPYLSKTIDIF